MQDLPEAFAKIPDKRDIRILVPGAGLGRLVLELASRGYNIEGNEISYHALLASSWILNQTEQAEQHSLYPLAFDFSNSNFLSRADQLEMVEIPDIHPATVLAEPNAPSCKTAIGRMKMTAADFLELYNSHPENKDKFDAVATVFFLDTAPDGIRYTETVRNCFKFWWYLE